MMSNETPAKVNETFRSSIQLLVHASSLKEQPVIEIHNIPIQQGGKGEPEEFNNAVMLSDLLISDYEVSHQLFAGVVPSREDVHNSYYAMRGALQSNAFYLQNQIAIGAVWQSSLASFDYWLTKNQEGLGDENIHYKRQFYIDIVSTICYLASGMNRGILTGSKIKMIELTEKHR